ncbi:MAG: hypothetical protein Tsb0013_10220 [Phycisphaerales bacterium]
MTRGFTLTCIASALALSAAAADCRAQVLIDAELFASGFSRPVFVTHAPNDFDRVFVLEQRSGSQGRIRVVDRATGAVNPTPFLTVNVSTGSEQGLLGMAFHPNYESNGLFYINYTRTNGDTVIAEYQVSANPDIADASSAKTVMIIDQPFSNHNAGWIGFSPWDGMLYIPLGDGGSGNDPLGSGQNTNTLLGSVLRIDVDTDDFPSDATKNYGIPADNPFVGGGGLPEIWAYGLRNPYRCSFDRATGDFWMGDVGQNATEEVDVQPFDSTGGENYGWRCMEGNDCTGLSGCTCFSAALTDPIYDYARSGGQCSVIGGYVYRGCAIPEFRGEYIFADYCSTNIWSFTPSSDLTGFSAFMNRTTQLEPPGTPTIGLISSFGEDAYGELYITDLSDGEIFKIVPEDPTPRTDCNNNGIEDDCELLDGSASDTDGSGVPDVCEQDFCLADFNADGEVNLGDFGVFGASFGSMPGDSNWDPRGDFDGNGMIDLGDFGTFGSEFGRTDCPPPL